MLASYKYEQVIKILTTVDFRQRSHSNVDLLHQTTKGFMQCCPLTNSNWPSLDGENETVLLPQIINKLAYCFLDWQMAVCSGSLL